jgi:urea carboxylase
MFTKVLIANRGAIATRIIRTLRRLNIQSVAVYASSDSESLHVRLADEAYCLGDGGAQETYLNTKKILSIAHETGSQAIHPGYGFLSENADFVSLCEQHNICFIGPSIEQIENFGLKHTARDLAVKANVPLLPGSGLLNDLTDAQQQAETIGYPVMLKSTAGGGGIGMQLCNDRLELDGAFESVKRLGANNFSDDGVFIEKYISRARHIEVQIVGDGKGNTVSLGERDCSSQRRNQKVVEECPAPNLSNEVREQLHRTAEKLTASIAYRNAGTVEFIVDADSQAFYFLEVNTRLQVEHGVTEEVYGVDLVEWMLRIAANDTFDLVAERQKLTATGHAIQVRLYAEDPYKNFQPSPGLLTAVEFPTQENIRVDTWVEAGVEVPPYFDPMIAKLIVKGSDREQALMTLQKALAETQLYGTETNLHYLQKLSADQQLQLGKITTRYLDRFEFSPARIDVVQGGTQTTIQDVPSRAGYWDVGVPPSGPFDNYSFRLANRLLLNDEKAAGLEITLQGPTLQFSCDTQIVIGGAPINATIDGEAIDLWQLVTVKAGQQLILGRIQTEGARSYLCVRGGIQCPEYLGSRSTFTLGQFGGHNGRALHAGDVLHLDEEIQAADDVQILPPQLKPAISNGWQLRVIYGPHGSPDFFTEQDIDTFFDHEWEVHYNSSRTGVRLIGPKPHWARKDGGEAGLHPSNIHDNAYAFGSVDFTGDMPVILGPDGPSLGGFVCPATVITADLWKLGQLRAGDKIQFSCVSIADAVKLEAQQKEQINGLTFSETVCEQVIPKSPIIEVLDATQFGDTITYRAAGDHFLLVEYGEQVLDIRLRFRAHALMQWLQKNPKVGLRELTPGIRSLQIHYDSQKISLAELLTYLKQAEEALSQSLGELTVPSRIVNIPLSWDDIACRQAIEKYDQSVRSNAPWSPSNLEFIRRINGLDSIDDVKKIVFDASYLVMGLGDVYLGAPVATPIDPRHRLVTTKYNPARTWTAENSVGIGGSYMCVYGMEGPGGYQFVGRTLQMWNRYRQTKEFENPWLLRFFDQIRFYEVSHDELQKIRKDFPLGQYPLEIEQGHFSLSEYEQTLTDNAGEIDDFKCQRNSAFEQELARWHTDGQFNYKAKEQAVAVDEVTWPEESIAVDSPVSGSVWQVESCVGDRVEAGQVMMILESMKMEIPVVSPVTGTVTHVLLSSGGRINAGQPLIVIEEQA